MNQSTPMNNGFLLTTTTATAKTMMATEWHTHTHSTREQV